MDTNGLSLLSIVEATRDKLIQGHGHHRHQSLSMEMDTGMKVSHFSEEVMRSQFPSAKLQPYIYPQYHCLAVR